MGTEPRDRPDGRPQLWGLLTILAAVAGLALLIDGAGSSSATYDEVAYVRIATTWWRTGDQDEITRMGSPLTFWKLQQAPTLWLIDRTGRGDWIDDPTTHHARLLPRLRIGALGIWALALAITAAWARSLAGPRAMAAAAWLFALGPNLLAHGGLLTMELPVTAAWAGALFLFDRFLATGRRRWFVASAAAAGLAFSCKYTTILLPPLLAAGWWIDRVIGGDRRFVRLTIRVGGGMASYVALLLAANLVVTAGATLPLSPRTGDHPSLDGRVPPWAARLAEVPLPRDWVGLATQIRHQGSGGPSYLFGERRQYGWRHYYLVALAVKLPLLFWPMVVARLAITARRGLAAERRAVFPMVVAVGFLAIASTGSSRNYGLRYLLPVAPALIAWAAGAVEGGRWGRRLVVVAIAGNAVAVATIHPHELTYFNVAAGGPIGGRRILADSNLDWGQGARSLRRLQDRRPELCDLTLYYFGDTSPAHYVVAGTIYAVDAAADQPGLPPRLRAKTAFVAVSASLQHGPWGPAGYFRGLDRATPVAFTDDTTIAVYRSADVALAPY